MRGHLPAESSSYYHEYTVITPGAPTRGTRWIITGGTPLTSPPNWYYTGDHYASFWQDHRRQLTVSRVRRSTQCLPTHAF
ncbi:ribonuclease domain-containing protein [Flexivirga alba]|uniref:Ribonuclease domain-containing protein n=1 Tax=Flexivirga alba TaxID=702742 RepID=A0ABW2AEX2_9MICO